MKLKKLESRMLVKTRNITAAVILTLFLVFPSFCVAGENKPMSADELRKAQAEKAASLLKAPPGGVWRATAAEALEALAITGDPREGEEVYGVCAACHYPTGWGDPLGVFPQLAGQHTNVQIKQIADIRAKNRDNATMYPFAMQIEGAQDIRDVCAYVQTLKMNPDPRVGPGGPSWVLSNLRKEVWPISLDNIQQKVGNENFKKLKSLEEKEFKSKKAFIDAAKAAVGTGEFEKHQAVILKNADWETDLALGKKLYEENCVRCHGDRGQGNWQQPIPLKEGEKAQVDAETKMEPGYFPVLAGQTYLYMVRQFSWIQIGKRRNANPDMVKQIKGFSFLDMKSAVDHSCRFKMKEGDWQEVGDQEKEGWDLDEKEEDDDKPAFMR